MGEQGGGVMNEFERRVVVGEVDHHTEASRADHVEERRTGIKSKRLLYAFEVLDTFLLCAICAAIRPHN